MLRFLTAGESHGPFLTVIIDGVPANLPIKAESINAELKRRQTGYGRGGRMSIENDRVLITGGVRAGRTIGAPLAFVIENKDWPNWSETMKPEPDNNKLPGITRPRPGHADLAGMQKYGFTDIRNVLERASARETAARVVVGAVAKRLLAEINVTVESCVVAVGYVSIAKSIAKKGDGGRADKSDVRILDNRAARGIRKAIDNAAETGDTLGGVFEVVVFGVPVGLGSYAQWDRRLDSALAAAVMSIPAVKGVEIGEGFEIARLPGSKAHDEIYYSRNHGYYRKTNRAGGLEGGITNGEPVRIKAAMKPIPTLGKPLRTVNAATKKAAKATKERADICAVPAASIVAEAMVAITMAGAVLEKFGGDSLAELKTNLNSYLKRAGL